MKNLAILLLTTTISFSCFAFNKTEYAKAEVNKTFSVLSTTQAKKMEGYYKNKNCEKAIQIIKDSNESYFSLGFVNGIFEEDLECLKKQSKETIKEIHRLLEPALWITHGDGGAKAGENTIDTFLKNPRKLHASFSENITGLSLLSGYYYATGNKRVFDVMKAIIQQAKTDYCFSKADPEAKLGDCPTPEQVKSAENELKNTQQDYEDEGARKANEYLKSFYLEQIAKSKEEGCIYGPCPDQETLYFAAEFLKRYDTNWYNQNVKNWMKEKEKIYLVRDKKEAEESAKRVAENERKRAERKKADDELRKMGVDLDGDTNKIGIIMYNPKTGKTQKF